MSLSTRHFRAGLSRAAATRLEQSRGSILSFDSGAYGHKTDGVSDGTWFSWGRLPGTSVPGFHVPPLRGWSILEARFYPSIREPMAIRQVASLTGLGSLGGAYPALPCRAFTCRRYAAGAFLWLDFVFDSIVSDWNRHPMRPVTPNPL